MPELPDVTVYIEALRERIVRPQVHPRADSRPVPAALRRAAGFRGRRTARHRSPARGQADRHRIRKWRLARASPDDRRPAALESQPAKVGGKNLAAFEFENGFLLLTEAGTQHRAAIRMAEGEAALRALAAGGIEPLDATLEEFAAALRSANHTLKRALTDPHLFSGIGNAYSDEILHRAKLSPIAMTFKLTDDQVARLYAATRESLVEWTDRLRAEAAGKFPEKVTAFREGMAVHGRYGEAVPALRLEGAAHPLRVERDELLPNLPDRRQTARRPRPVAPAARRLAAHARGVGGVEETLGARQLHSTSCGQLMFHSPWAKPEQSIACAGHHSLRKRSLPTSRKRALCRPESRHTYRAAVFQLTELLPL